MDEQARQVFIAKRDQFRHESAALRKATGKGLLVEDVLKLMFSAGIAHERGKREACAPGPVPKWLETPVAFADGRSGVRRTINPAYEEQQAQRAAQARAHAAAAMNAPYGYSVAAQVHDEVTYERQSVETPECRDAEASRLTTCAPDDARMGHAFGSAGE